MSLARMFLSGFLVAGGIILAAFTLHGYLDPDWQRKQVEAARAGDMEVAKAREQANEAISASTFQPKERAVVGRTEPAAPEPKPPAAKPAPKPDPPATADVKPKPAAPKKKAADKPPEKAPPPQQASFSWQKVFGGN